MITMAELPAHFRVADSPTAEPPADPAAGLTLKQAKQRWIGQLEAAYIADLLKQEGGNVSGAARKAGVDRKTLHRLLNKHRIRS